MTQRDELAEYLMTAAGMDPNNQQAFEEGNWLLDSNEKWGTCGKCGGRSDSTVALHSKDCESIREEMADHAERGGEVCEFF